MQGPRVDPVDGSNRLFMLSHALMVVMALKTIVMSTEVSQWTGEHLGDAPQLKNLPHICTLSFGRSGGSNMMMITIYLKRS